MKRSNKKGFTIVELVVVIAVIAILAAVLIPTFASLVKKANASKDVQTVRDLNTAIAVYVNEALKGDETTISEALAAAANFGYDIGKINAKADGNEILWDDINNVFCYLNEGKVEYVPEFPNVKTASGADYWVIANAPSATYSTYLVDYEGTSVEAIHNLDVSACGAIDVVYNGDATVAITLNGGNLTVEKGNVVQYGAVRFLEVADGAECDKKGEVVADLAEVEKVEDTTGWTVVKNADELTAALANGGKILLGANITVSTELRKADKANNITEKANSFEVTKDTEINLNGFNITGVHTNNVDTLNLNNVLINVKNAELTLSGYGVVSLKYEGTNMQWNALSATLRLAGSTGTINVNDAVVVEHLGGTPMSYAIDAYATGNANTLNVNGGALYSSYIAIRWFYPNATSTGKINVNGGLFFGTSRDIWFQGSAVECADLITIADSYDVTVDGVNYFID